MEESTDDAAILDQTISELSLPTEPIHLRALYAFDGVPDYRELSFEQGARMLLVTDEVADGWILAEYNGVKGLVPKSYVVFEEDFVGHVVGSPPSRPASISGESPEWESSRKGTAGEGHYPNDSYVGEEGSTVALDDAPSMVTSASHPLYPQLSVQPLQRTSTRRGWRQLNRISSFVTSGCEEFVLSGSNLDRNTVMMAANADRSQLGPDTMSSMIDAEDKMMAQRFSEEFDGITDADKHFIKSGPSWMAKTPEFVVKVHDPEKRTKMGGMQEFTIYNVTSEFSKGETVTVERRFSQFDWLHQMISRKFAALIIPPLPEKRHTGRFLPEFVEKRRRALERYLNRLARHPVIRYSDLFIHFLSCMDDVEWKRKERDFKTDPVVAQHFFQHVHHIEFNVDEDGDMETVQKFYDHTKAIDRFLPHMTNGAEGYINQLKETGNQFRRLAFGLLALITGTMDENDNGNGGVTEEDGAWCWRDKCRPCLSLTKALQSTSDAMQSISAHYQEHTDRNLVPWLEFVQEYGNSSNAQFPLYEMHYGAHKKFLELDKDVEAAIAAGKMDFDAEEIKSRCETVFNVTLAEMDRFHTDKGRDFRDAAVQFIDAEIVFHERIVAELRRAREVYAPEKYASLSETPRVASEHTRDMLDNIQGTATSAPGSTSVAGVRSVVGGVVGGVGTMGSYISGSINAAGKRGGVFNWGWGN